MRRACGFTLIEMIVVLVLTAILIGLFLNGYNAYDRWRRAQAFGAAVQAVADALEKYGQTYRSALINNTAITGYASPNAPTVAELKADTTHKFLPSGFSTTPMPGGGYVTSVVLTPSGCAAVDCNLAYFVYATKPALDETSRELDIDFTSMAAQSISAGRGGWSDKTNFNGIGGAWRVANPTGDAGLLAASSNYQSDLLSLFLRVDGGNAMAAPLHMADNDIDRAGTVNANLVTLRAPATVGAACAIANQIAAGADGTPLICLGSNWRRIGFRYASVGDACTGSEVAADTSGQALVCRNNALVSLSDRLPKVVDMAQAVVNNGASIAKPTCGTGGAAALTLVPINPGGDFTIAPPATRTNVTYTDNGTTWTATVQAVDQNGTASALSVQALARTHCVY